MWIFEKNSLASFTLLLKKAHKIRAWLGYIKLPFPNVLYDFETICRISDIPTSGLDWLHATRKKNNQYQYCFGIFKAMPWFLYVIFWTRVFFRTDTCMSVWKCIPLSLCDFLCVRVKRVHTFLMYMYMHVLYCAPLPLRPITTQLPQLQSSYGKLHCNIYCCMTPS